MVKFTFRSDVSRVGDAVSSSFPALLRKLEEKIISSCEPFVPYDTGNLCNSGKATGVGERGEVTYSAEYAAVCYYSSRSFNKKKHPHACARWFEAAKASDLTDWIITAKTHFMKPAGMSENSTINNFFGNSSNIDRVT